MALKRWLVDTGPFVAYLDRSDPWHAHVSARLNGFSGQLVTTGAVITEVMYFVSQAPQGPLAFAELLVKARVEIAGISLPASVLDAAKLMRQYADTPMDFADATLVSAGEQLGTLDILTLDRRGFSTYRTPAGKRFRLVLDADDTP